MKDTISLYLKKRSIVSFDKTTFLSRKTFVISIVIPVFDEYPTLFKTLESLDESIKSTAFSHYFCVILVINNKKSSLSSVKINNERLFYECKMRTYSFSLFPLDCFSLGNEISEKMGVGYARRYGMDYAVASGSAVLACMDADVLVSKNYADELVSFFQKKRDVALCSFKHQKAVGKESFTIQEAIDNYEFYLKEHSKRLFSTGSPYWPYALGPTIVCSSKIYAECAGMPKKIAGEDFYFLQALIKICIQKNAGAVFFLSSTVYPEARLSNRVLFGTGPTLIDALGGKNVPKVFSSPIYAFLEIFIKTVESSIQVSNNVPLSKDSLEMVLKKEIPIIEPFLEQENFFSLWHRLCIEHKNNNERLKAAFHIWFDGLKIIRLIHFLEEKGF